MSTRRIALLSLALAALLVTAPLAAETFYVQLKNGSKFESRYQPKADPEDPSKVLFLTGVGNWISLDRSDVEGVTSETETKGFGTVIDTTTIMLGLAPNDAAGPSEAAQSAGGAEQLLNFLQQQQGTPINTEQFVDPSEAGVGGGLPAYFGGVGGGGSTVSPIIVPRGGGAFAPPPSGGGDGVNEQ